MYQVTDLSISRRLQLLQGLWAAFGTLSRQPQFDTHAQYWRAGWLSSEGIFLLVLRYICCLSMAETTWCFGISWDFHECGCFSPRWSLMRGHKSWCSREADIVGRVKRVLSSFTLLRSLGRGKLAWKAAWAGSIDVSLWNVVGSRFPSDRFLLCLDQQSGYGKVSRRGGHQNSYKPY